jgi:protein-arginine kinase
MSKWYNAQGNNSDVVMSSKIRLARNLADAPFPQE